MTVPQLVAGCDVQSLALSEKEAFILSKVDGRRTFGDLAALTGVDRETIAEVMAHLLEVRAVWITGPLTSLATTGSWPSAAISDSVPIDIDIEWTDESDAVTASYPDRPSQRPTIPGEPPKVDWDEG